MLLGFVTDATTGILDHCGFYKMNTQIFGWHLEAPLYILPDASTPYHGITQSCMPTSLLPYIYRVNIDISCMVLKIHKNTETFHPVMQAKLKATAFRNAAFYPCMDVLHVLSKGSLLHSHHKTKLC